MDLKKFRYDYRLSQNDLAVMFECGQGHISNIEKGVRNLTQGQLKLLIEKYSFDVVSQYLEENDLVPASTSININAPKIQQNSGQVNGGDGTQNVTSDPSLVAVLNRQSEQISTLLAQQERLIALLEGKK